MNQLEARKIAMAHLIMSKLNRNDLVGMCELESEYEELVSAIKRLEVIEERERRKHDNQ